MFQTSLERENFSVSFGCLTFVPYLHDSANGNGNEADSDPDLSSTCFSISVSSGDELEVLCAQLADAKRHLADLA